MSKIQQAAESLRHLRKSSATRGDNESNHKATAQNMIGVRKSADDEVIIDGRDETRVSAN